MTGFTLSDDLEALRASVRRLAEERIAPHAAAADEDEQYPWESWKAWSDAGFAGLAFPEEYGGQSGGFLAHALCVEEVARVCASSSLFTFISKLGMTPVLDHGSEALKRRYVPRVASGEYQASYCLSEADAGSDVAGMRTRAVRDGDHYVLSGRKLWITNAGVSDLYTVFAKTDPDAGHRGISCFVVEKGFAGFSVSKLEHKMGVRGSPTGEIVLDECAVPAENLIGEEGRGFAYAMGALDRSRPLVGAQALGIAQGALELATSYVRERKQFDHPIADFQGVQFMLADLATAVDASRLLVYRACALLDDGLGGTPLTASASSMAKLFASDTAMRVTTDCVQLLGGIGYTKDMPAERFMRDAKITQIYEGTNQIQRVVIAKRLLGG
ncbi:MAG TPA: acyl-CoA dehydrogenase family protein [Acidimicrobiia bacterium]|nr:acyl-CoA dehydrogenase family protein [Acidimicrobiia bacterium]